MMEAPGKKRHVERPSLWRKHIFFTKYARLGAFHMSLRNGGHETAHFSLNTACPKTGTPVHSQVEYDKANDHVEMRRICAWNDKTA